MGVLDIFIILLFFGSIIYGFCRGVIIQLGSVGGILLGIILCRLFGHAFTGHLAGDHPTPNELYVTGVFANIILFLVGYVSARLVARLIKTISSKLRLSPLDRIAGAVFSLFEWFFIFSLLLNVWQAVDSKADVTANSKLGDGKAAEAVMDFAPWVLDTKTAQSILNFAAD